MEWYFDSVLDEKQRSVMADQGGTIHQTTSPISCGASVCEREPLSL